MVSKYDRDILTTNAVYENHQGILHVSWYRNLFDIEVASAFAVSKFPAATRKRKSHVICTEKFNERLSLSKKPKRGFATPTASRYFLK